MPDAAAIARQYRDPVSRRSGIVITYQKPVLIRVSIGKRRYVRRSFDNVEEAMAWAEAQRVVGQQSEFVPLARRR